MSDVDKAVATAVEEQHEKQNNPTQKKKWRRLKEIDKFGETSMYKDPKAFKSWLYADDNHTFLYLSVGLVPRLSDYYGRLGKTMDGKFNIAERREWLNHFNHVFKQLPKHNLGRRDKWTSKISADDIANEIDNRYNVMDYSRKYRKLPFYYGEYKEAITFFGLEDNVFHTGESFLAARDKNKASLLDCNLANVKASETFKRHEKFLKENLIDLLYNQKKDYVMKNHHRFLTDHWKKILIEYFDNGDYEFRKKLFNLHRKKGLSASEHFKDFMIEHEERLKQNRIEREKKKKEKSKKQKRNTDNTKSNETEQGEIH